MQNGIIPFQRFRLAEPRRMRLFSVLFRTIQLLGRKMAERRNRNALMELSDDQLKDIGLSRSKSSSGAHFYSRY
ncbi:DUF1127 domain-containing protein [Rhizobium sp. P38BS-XIX]|nr:DUF1127 domain-containing protein [Rhizobium sp. P38BS-XIX]